MPMKIWPLRACMQSSFSSTSPIPSSGRHTAQRPARTWPSQDTREPADSRRQPRATHTEATPESKRTQAPADHTQPRTHTAGTHGGANRHKRKDNERHSSVRGQSHRVTAAPPWSGQGAGPTLGNGFNSSSLRSSDPVCLAERRVGVSGAESLCSRRVWDLAFCLLREAHALPLLWYNFQRKRFSIRCPIGVSQETREEDRGSTQFIQEKTTGLPHITG